MTAASNSDARKRAAEHVTPRLFVDEDAYGNPCIWLENPADAHFAYCLLARTQTNAQGFDALAQLVKDHA